MHHPSRFRISPGRKCSPGQTYYRRKSVPQQGTIGIWLTIDKRWKSKKEELCKIAGVRNAACFPFAVMFNFGFHSKKFHSKIFFGGLSHLIKMWYD